MRRLFFLFTLLRPRFSRLLLRLHKFIPTQTLPNRILLTLVPSEKSIALRTYRIHIYHFKNLHKIKINPPQHTTDHHTPLPSSPIPSTPIHHTNHTHCYLQPNSSQNDR